MNGERASYEVARAIDALRRGWPVSVEGRNGRLDLLAVETLSEDSFAAVTASGLLISSHRAETLRIVNQRAAADTAYPVAIAVPPDADLPDMMAIADPVLDLANPLKGPFRAIEVDAPEAASAALELARLAGLMPALLLLNRGSVEVEAAVSTDAIASYAVSDGLFIATQAALPVSASETARIVAFRTRADATEHVALIIGKRDASPPLVRIHSECLTGDVFGSLKCDCGPQLHRAMAEMAQSQWGVLLYLRQEGRGIGLINKLRAYMLQDQGFDTVDANLRLGFESDSRGFAVAASMLRLINVDTVDLMTNNPDKVAGLSAEGIKVRSRIAHKAGENPHNEKYLATKRDRSGHQL